MEAREEQSIEEKREKRRAEQMNASRGMTNYQAVGSIF
jgi:hypothetical protein